MAPLWALGGHFYFGETGHLHFGPTSQVLIGWVTSTLAPNEGYAPKTLASEPERAREGLAMIGALF